ncbi:hypothetical protein BJ138DRAFT_1184570 [Hygrophoropsis aurantiaca]|uniref:Uncharacterized protein n=1 Tax=Hygrophoropsis aurantiaca TaxID=72124 RepID=A0ACB7ZPK9_9AGAM|nr:hypothetical protein BJ138DRAFT_1184570 [Hygrophoropsis aurantiaca]
MRSSKQREATKRWLAQPDVSEIQREKARVRAKKNRDRKKAESASCSSTVNSNAACVHATTSPTLPSPQTSFLRPPKPDHRSEPTLESLRESIDRWKVDWGPQVSWNKEFNKALARARETPGTTSVDRFFNECEKHTLEGWAILNHIKSIAQGSWTGGARRIGEQVVQLHDMLLEVVCEVKFFEFRYDEYSPIVPIWKVAELRYHEGYEYD